MSLDSVRQIVESLFTPAWGVTTKIKYENVDLDTTNEDSYVALAIREGQSSQASLGETGDYVLPGVVIVSVFTKNNIGSSTARVLGDQVAAIFRGQISGAVQFQVPYGNVMPNNTDWFQYNITIPFYAYFGM